MARVAIILILLLIGGAAKGQVFEDDFSDGDFSTNPGWSGADSNFVIFELDGNNVLRLDDNEAGVSYLSTTSAGITGFWEFFVRIDGSAPSGSNKAEIILVSDISDLTGAFNGYGVRIGETGDDFFRLIRYDSGTEAFVVLSDTTVFEAGGSYRVKVTRDGSGNWSMEVGAGYNGELKNSGNSALDDTYTVSSFLGVRVSYTVTRVDDFYFDFKIDPPPVMIDPLFVDSFSAVSNAEIELSFSRDIDFATAINTNFLLNGALAPQNVINRGTNELRLSFEEPFPGGENQLFITGIRSSNNDTVLTDTTISFFVFEDFESGDVKVNEFLKDPPPDSGIPEFIELVNRSSKILNLKDWQVGDNNTLVSISDTNYVLQPDTFLVLTNDPEALESVFGVINALDVSLPALNNTTDQIRMYDENGATVDSLEYTPDWGGVDVSLERRSLDVSSTFRANWGDSPNSDFATPGAENEIEPDTTPPYLESFEILNDSTFQLIFNEQIKPGPASNPENYAIEIPTLLKGISGENEFVKATFFEPDTVILEFHRPYYTGSNPNGLAILNQEDVFGNVAELIGTSYELIRTDLPKPGDLVINEIMYDPPPGFSEFMEINLHAYKVFNLKGWTISDNSGEEIIITEEDFFIANSGVSFDRGIPWNQHVILVPNSTIQVSANRRIVNSRFPTLNNTSDAIVLKDPNGVVIDSLTYFSSWGGNEVSLERRSPELPSNFRANWGDSPDDDLATPAQNNAIGLDESAPKIEGFSILGDQSIQLIFDEQIQDSSAVKIENYGLTNPMSASPILFRPESVEFSSPDTVWLTFQQSFFEFNLLEVFNQTDVFGNKSEREIIEFEYVVTVPALEGEVKITEFAYDAPEGFSEFVEIHNPTTKNFDLLGWTFNDNSGNRKVITGGSFFLKAGEYAILAPDSTIIENFGSKKLLDVPGFPALNNSTDELVLRNKNGVLMDSLTYSSNWGGEEVSLERRSVEVSGIYLENWGDSPSPDKGTPGSANAIPPDETPPTVINSGFISNREILLLFDERLFGESATNPENYYDESGPNPFQALAMADSVTLSYENPLEDGDSVSIRLRNLEDLFGNVQNEQVVKLTYVELGQENARDVVFNEIMYRRKDAVSPEFVELFNTSDTNFDLSGWSFSDAGSSSEIPMGTILNSGNYLVLTDREDFASTLQNGLYLSNFPSLNDSGDELVLRNSEGVTIDSLFYESSWGGNEPGVSVERRDPLAASSDASNWGSSTSESGFSAGIMSSNFEEDATPPEIIFSSQIDSVVRVVFSEFVVTGNESRFFVNDEETDLINSADPPENELYLRWIQGPIAVPGKKAGSFNTDVRIENISDVRGNVAAQSSLPIASALIEGAIIINEILFNPLADNDDNLPDQSEYIEIFNRSNTAISLEGLFIHDAPDEEGEIRAITPVSTQFKWIPPGAYHLIYSEDGAEDFGQSKISAYFELEGVVESEVIRVDRSSLSLASTGDAIFLADSSGATIDSVFYDESWQNPNLIDTRGVALERIDPNGPGNDETNWSSSTHVSGGTPLLENTIFQEAEAPPAIPGLGYPYSMILFIARLTAWVLE